jgi:hypothetical protein
LLRMNSSSGQIRFGQAQRYQNELINHAVKYQTRLKSSSAPKNVVFCQNYFDTRPKIDKVSLKTF